MSIDYMVCDSCGKPFPDVNGFENCAYCGRVYCEDCSAELAQKYGTVGEESEDTIVYGPDALPECDKCNGTIIEDSELLDYIAAKYSLELLKEKEELAKQRKE